MIKVYGWWKRSKRFFLLAWGLPVLVMLQALCASPGFTDFNPYTGREPFVAEPYVPPPPPPPKVILTDNHDGTLTDNKGLMWTQMDSYADLGRCLTWYEAEEYVKNLTTGGHADWRMPSIRELYGIYDDTKENNIAWNHDPENPLHLSTQFADGAAYWYWSNEMSETQLTDCCAYSYYFVKGFYNLRRLSSCSNGGVRAVRKAK